jgi:hypothetical protein
LNFILLLCVSVWRMHTRLLLQLKKGQEIILIFPFPIKHWTGYVCVFEPLHFLYFCRRSSTCNPWHIYEAIYVSSFGAVRALQRDKPTRRNHPPHNVVESRQLEFPFIWRHPRSRTGTLFDSSSLEHIYILIGNQRRILK